ncbi:MAG: methyltransferase domain-containing protein [Magnetococcus sp. YQC-9]
MSTARRIASTFGAAAPGYEAHAGAQAHAARRLGERLTCLPLPEAPRILELGCGTGLLTRLLLQLYPDARILATDRAIEMVRAARVNLVACDRVDFAVMDGERLAMGGGFDLITANLAWQWFEDPLAAFAHCQSLLNPAGWIGITTLGEENFAEWRGLCEQNGLPHGLRAYPTRRDWQARLAPTAMITEESYRCTYPSALEFLRALRAIGAQSPARGYRPQSPGLMRRVLRGGEKGFVSSYHLLYIADQKPF